MIDDALYKSVEKMDTSLMDALAQALEDEYVPLVKKTIMEEYDNQLVSPVTDMRSKTNPLIYRKEFENALDIFPFIKRGSSSTTFVMPDLENFPWGSGKLVVIKHILEGIIGTYVEVTADQYVRLFGKKNIQEDPYDKTVPAKERVYLVRYTNDVQKKEYQLFKSAVFVRYPFSNSPPIRLFDAALKYVQEGANEWLTNKTAELTKNYSKGDITLS
jgi:hypothetical protein